LQGNIRVLCRVRPFMQHDADQRDKPSEMHLVTSGDRPKVQVIQQAAPGGRSRAEVLNEFEFDQVFMHNKSQHDVFAEVAPLLQSVMDGFRLCIFAYGQVTPNPKPQIPNPLHLCIFTKPEAPNPKPPESGDTKPEVPNPKPPASLIRSPKPQTPCIFAYGQVTPNAKL
jgi:hypothetical protein